MTKAQLAHALHRQVEGLSRQASAQLVDLVFETMKETLGRGETLKVPRFGDLRLAR